MHFRRPLTPLALAALLASFSVSHAASLGATDRSAPRPVATPSAAADTAENGAAAGGVMAAEALEASVAREGLRPEVLRLALRAYQRAATQGLATRPVLTVVDYSRPSRERRLWVVDLTSGAVLAHELVAHGKNSGDDLARRFSNVDGSEQTSLGTFVTGATYTGKHGLSLKLRGLDAGLNDHAESRAIVVHAADYVNESIVGALGRLGRSQGCPALSNAAAPRVIDLIKGGTVFFAYYPTAALERALS
jgi:hypothetical protein